MRLTFGLSKNLKKNLFGLKNSKKHIWAGVTNYSFTIIELQSAL